MKKRALLILSVILISMFAVVFISAENDTAIPNATTLAGFDKSYKCLQDSIDAKPNKYTELSLEELSYSLLALGYDKTRQDALKTELESRRDVNNCWPKDACTVKATALVLMAYNNIQTSTLSIENWLINQTASASDLVWYLQIDTANKSTCKISYNNGSVQSTVSVENDKTISGSPGNCFSASGYWLKVSPSCYGKDFEISCDSDFITSMLFTRGANAKLYVSDLTNTGVANTKTTERVNSLCFKLGSTCNFESTMWAAVALQKAASDRANLKKLVPYLIAFYEDSGNQRFFPSVFLYALTGYDEYASSIINLQNVKDGYWQLSDSSKRYYDTALALMAINKESSAPSQVETAKNYLLRPDVQGEGCWQNSIRDTAFLLYAASPKTAYNSGGGTTTTTCKSHIGYECMSDTECTALGGDTYTSAGYSCFGFGVCCDKPSKAQTCSDKGGKTCLSNEKCDGDTALADDTSVCCLGICVLNNDNGGGSAGYSCESNNGICKSSCANTERESSDYTCEAGNCCIPSTAPPSKSYWWVWLLVILIILAGAGIIFRDKLKVWFYQLTGKIQKSSVSSQTRPLSPMTPASQGFRQPMPMMRRPFAPPGIPGRNIPISNRPFPKDKELDETLKKLKDMGNK